MITIIIEQRGRIIKYLMMIPLIICLNQPLQAFIVNEIWATVNDSPVTSLDIYFFREKIPQIKDITPIQGIGENELLDELISQALLTQIADEETVRAPQDKLEERINAIMEANNLKSKLELDKKLKKRGTSLEIYEEEIKRQLVTHQLISLFVPVAPPSESQMQSWYNKNKDKLGKMVHLKEIVIRFNPKNVKDELAVDKKIQNIRSQILRKKDTFENLAHKYSEDKVTAPRGGDMGWVNLAEIDPMKAGMAYQMRNKRGSISQVFKARYGNEYVILRMDGIRDIRYSIIKEKIFRLLYVQAQEKAFVTWLVQRKKQAAIKIFKKDYKYKNETASQDVKDKKNSKASKTKKRSGRKHGHNR